MNPKNILKAIDGRSAAKILKEDAQFRMSKSESDGYFVLSIHINLTQAPHEIRHLVQKAFGSGSYEKFSKTAQGRSLDEFEIKSKYSVDLNDKEAKQAAANGFANLVCKKLNNEIKNVSMDMETERRQKFGLPTAETKPKGGALVSMLKRLVNPNLNEPTFSH